MARTSKKIPAGITPKTNREGRVGGTHVLHEPDANGEEVISGKKTHRLTTRSRAFIIRCINAGYDNRAISRLLRQKKFIIPGEADLSNVTFWRLRRTEDCALDVELLTLEARQYGHYRISQAILYWGTVLDAAYEKLMGIPASFPDFAGFGDNLKMMTAGECNALMMNATKILFDIFATDLGAKLKAELDAAEEGMEGQVQRMPDASEIGAYVEELVYQSLLEAKRKQAGITGVEGVNANDAEDTSAAALID